MNIHDSRAFKMLIILTNKSKLATGNHENIKIISRVVIYMKAAIRNGNWIVIFSCVESADGWMFVL